MYHGAVIIDAFKEAHDVSIKKFLGHLTVVAFPEWLVTNYEITGKIFI